METPRKKKGVAQSSPEKSSPEKKRSSEPPVEAKLPSSIAASIAEKTEPSKAAAKPSARSVKIKVRRQDEPDKPDGQRFETFEVALRPGLTVHGALAAIQKRPVTVDGKRVSPPVWEASCLEETCGACTMLIGGRARNACSTRLEEVSPKGQTVVLEPLSKFRVLRDLVVDRSRLFETFRAVSAWISIDPLFGSPAVLAADPASRSPLASDEGAPREGREDQELRLALSECIACGACLEACPEYGPKRAFMGAAAINQARLMNLHSTGKLERRRRLNGLMGAGGVADCGKAQNCVEVCPKGIPLVESIASMARDTTKEMIFGWILG